jgi:hypothetical protein
MRQQQEKSRGPSSAARTRRSLLGSEGDWESRFQFVSWLRLARVRDLNLWDENTRVFTEIYVCFRAIFHAGSFFVE